jgi:hypothetical protein
MIFAVFERWLYNNNKAVKCAGFLLIIRKSDNVGGGGGGNFKGMTAISVCAQFAVVRAP